MEAMNLFDDFNVYACASIMHGDNNPVDVESEQESINVVDFEVKFEEFNEFLEDLGNIFDAMIDVEKHGFNKDFFGGTNTS